MSVFESARDCWVRGVPMERGDARRLLDTANAALTLQERPRDQVTGTVLRLAAATRNPAARSRTNLEDELAPQPGDSELAVDTCKRFLRDTGGLPPAYRDVLIIHAYSLFQRQQRPRGIDRERHEETVSRAYTDVIVWVNDVCETPGEAIENLDGYLLARFFKRSKQRVFSELEDRRRDKEWDDEHEKASAASHPADVESQQDTERALDDFSDALVALAEEERGRYRLPGSRSTRSGAYFLSLQRHCKPGSAPDPRYPEQLGAAVFFWLTEGYGRRDSLGDIVRGLRAIRGWTGLINRAYAPSLETVKKDLTGFRQKFRLWLAEYEGAREVEALLPPYIPDITGPLDGPDQQLGEPGTEVPDLPSPSGPEGGSEVIRYTIDGVERALETKGLAATGASSSGVSAVAAGVGAALMAAVITVIVALVRGCVPDEGMGDDPGAPADGPGAEPVGANEADVVPTLLGQESTSVPGWTASSEPTGEGVPPMPERSPGVFLLRSSPPEIQAPLPANPWCFYNGLPAANSGAREGRHCFRTKDECRAFWEEKFTPDAYDAPCSPYAVEYGRSADVGPLECSPAVNRTWHGGEGPVECNPTAATCVIKNHGNGWVVPQLGLPGSDQEDCDVALVADQPWYLDDPPQRADVSASAFDKGGPWVWASAIPPGGTLYFDVAHVGWSCGGVVTHSHSLEVRVKGARDRVEILQTALTF